MVQLLTEERVAVVPAGSDLAEKDVLTPADLAAWPVALNTVAGTTTLDLWPADARPTAMIEVGNTDEWLTAIAVGRAVGISTSATPVCTRTRRSPTAR
ncbi:LysR substrate-binding domain-containing protein [Streptomyces sp. NPDC050448]|uniref:LysR substrate-binding domain-containing protein n=1 Tax=Streptomyces sp. NPDC050448 TaxID=3155404 RepID=UPI0034130BD2